VTQGLLTELTVLQPKLPCFRRNSEETPHFETCWVSLDGYPPKKMVIPTMALPRITIVRPILHGR